MRPGGRSRTLVRLRRNKEFADIAELSASTTRVAIFVQHSTGGEQSWVDWSLLLSGPIGGRLRTAAGTARPSGPIVDHAPEVDGGTDVTGHTVAWMSGDGRIHLRDFGDVADEQTLGPAAGVYGSYWGVRMSGRYVGAVYEDDGGSTTRPRVFDRSTGRQASDVRIPGSGCAAEVTGWDLESSGAVVAIHSAGDECQSYSLGWARRSERLLRDVVRVSHKAAFDSPVRAVYGRAVFLHGSERKTRLALVTPSGAVTDISFPLPAASFGAYDFDGRRVAFATKHCLYLATLPITAPDTPPAGPCRRRAAADRTARRDAAGSRRSAAPLDALSRSAPQGARP